MKKLIASVVFFGSFGVAFAQMGAGGLPTDAYKERMMSGIWRPNLCPVTTTKKVLMGCKLVSTLNQRYEGGSFFSGARYCAFLQGNQDYCSRGNTGQKGDCYNLNQGSRGDVCIGSSYKGMNCRAKCDITSATPFCVQKSDCSGSTAKSHCSPVYMDQPTTVFRECPKRNKCELSGAVLPGKTCEANDPYGCPTSYKCGHRPSGIPPRDTDPLVCVHDHIDGCPWLLPA